MSPHSSRENWVPSRAANWLPEGKRAAVCFSIDDVHPGRSTDAYEAGGDLGAGALGHVEWLLEHHPQLHVTLFTTPDWREIGAAPTHWILPRIPVLKDRIYLTKILPEGTMRLDRHPRFSEYLRALPRTEIGLHGLHHVHPGHRVAVEFQRQDARTCTSMLRKALRIFEAAKLDVPTGMCPPGWNLPPALVDAMIGVGMRYVASARDIRTSITKAARTNMSGLRDVSLIFPEFLFPEPAAPSRRLLHISSNFQATSDRSRAFEIIEQGGLLSIKAHIVKYALGNVALDGIDALYRNYLDSLFAELSRRYGESLWWTSMGEVSSRATPLEARPPAPSELRE